MEPLSPGNWRVKRVRRLVRSASERSDEGAFVVEGALIADALDGGADVQDLFAESRALDGAHGELVERASQAGATCHLVPEGTLDKIGDAVTSTGVLAVVAKCDDSLEVLSTRTDLSLVVVLAGVSDPGNAGTLLRVAEAAGADAVVTTAGSVDLFGPKAVRASAGTLFLLPVVVGVEPARALAALAGCGLRALGTAAMLGEVYHQADLSGPVALVLGNEAHGLPSDLAVDGWLRIPIRGRAESLNVATAGAVLCFEVARRREQSP